MRNLEDPQCQLMQQMYKRFVSVRELAETLFTELYRVECKKRDSNTDSTRQTEWFMKVYNTEFKYPGLTYFVLAEWYNSTLSTCLTHTKKWLARIHRNA